VTAHPRSGTARARRIALTGGIATGKSACAATLTRLGVPLLDADRLAHEAVRPGTPGLAAVVESFGPGVLQPDGQLDRAALGTIVFADPRARRDLEAIIHPIVYAGIARWFSTLDAPAGVADIPLLFETGHESDFDIVMVAACRPDQQLERLMARDGLSVSDARARIAAQRPIAEKAAAADVVIDTSGTLAQTADNTERAWVNLQSTNGNR